MRGRNSYFLFLSFLNLSRIHPPVATGARYVVQCCLLHLWQKKVASPVFTEVMQWEEKKMSETEKE